MMRKSAFWWVAWMMLLAWSTKAQQPDFRSLTTRLQAINGSFGGPPMFWELDNVEGKVMSDAYHRHSGGSQVRVGSLGKVVVALGIMQLVEQHKLALDAPVADWLPDLIDNPWEATDPVRVVHLLEHSSGLDDMHFNEYFRYDEPQTLEQALARNPHNKRIRWRPGTCSAYSNIGYAIAARLIERVTQQPFDIWLKAEVFQPLGMHKTYFELGCTDSDPPCGGPLLGKIGNSPVAHEPYLYASAVGLVSTGNDITRLMRFFMGHGRLDGQRLLDSATVARMFQHQTTPASIPQWYQGARGIGFNLWGPANDPAVRASGFVEGYLAQICILPGHGYGWLMLSNATTDDATYTAQISAQLDLALPARRWLPDSTSATLPSTHPPAGNYRFVSRRNALFSFYDDLYSGIHLQETEVDARKNYSAQPWIGGGAQENLTIVGNDFQDWDDATGIIVQAGQSAEVRDFLLIGERYFEYDPSPWPALGRLAFDIYRSLVWAGLAMVLVTIVGRIRGKTFAQAAFWTSIWGNIPYWCGALGLQLLRADLVFDLGRMSLPSIGILLLSLLFPIASILGSISFGRGLLRQQANGRWWLWLHLPLILGNLGLMAFLIAYGMLPFVSWSY